MRKKLLLFIILAFGSYGLIKLAKADLIPPIIYTQFQIMWMGLPATVGVICINWVGNFSFLLLFLNLAKYKIKNNFKKILITSLIGLALGLAADLASFFILKGIAVVLDPLFEVFRINPPEISIPISLFTISFFILYGIYYVVLKYLLRLERKKVKLVAISMAIFTNPVWFTLITGNLFTEYSVYFTPRKAILGDCRGAILSQCVSCSQINWSEERILPSEVEWCIELYSWRLNLTMPKRNNCSTIKLLCEKLSPQLKSNL